jgi:hypothetical protein
VFTILLIKDAPRGQLISRGSLQSCYKWQRNSATGLGTLDVQMRISLAGVSRAIWTPRTARKTLRGMKLSRSFYVFTCEDDAKLMWRNIMMKLTFAKQPPLLEDLRNHTPEQLAEVRMLLNSCAPSRPDPRRPGFFEIDGECSVYYIFRYPNGSKVLLIGVWDRQRDPVAEIVACSCCSAA